MYIVLYTYRMSNTLPISQARSTLPSLIDRVSINEFFITVKGKVKAALVDADQYRQMKETLAIMSDQSTMGAIQESLEDLRNNNLVDWDQVKSTILK